jgi:hypothetical protein
MVDAIDGKGKALKIVVFEFGSGAYVVSIGIYIANDTYWSLTKVGKTAGSFDKLQKTISITSTGLRVVGESDGREVEWEIKM